jgi:O-antigen/teichoic acid export membrane protein
VNRRNPFSMGMLVMAAGLGLNGIAAYAFLAIAARQLPTPEHDALAVLWAFTFLMGPGFFAPLEQELSRIISSRRSVGTGAGPVLRQAAFIGAGVLGALILLTLVFSPFIVDRIFDGHWVLLIGLELSLLGYCLGHLVRGVLAGHGRFVPYARFFVGEGIGRLAVIAIPVAAGSESLLAYALAMGLAPFIGVVLAAWGQRGISEPGPDAHLGDLSRALGSLLAASVLTAALLNMGPIVVKLLADSDGDHEAGRFLNALVVSRVPLFFFQAVQAALLPQLAALAGTGRHDELWRALRRILYAVGALLVVGVLGAAVLGPFVVETMFGEDFAVAGLDMALLALSSALFMAGVAIAQGLIALGGQGPTALGWLAGVLVFPVALLFGSDVFLRVEIALVCAVGTAAVAMFVQFRWLLRAESGQRLRTLSPSRA